ncbi:MAG: FecR family protein [Gallionellaceae bacterium]
MLQFILLTLLTALLAPVAHAAGSNTAGEVIYIRDAAFANRDGASINLLKNTPIIVGDHIVTGHNARVVLRMIDGAVLTLGADTEFAIGNYSYSKSKHQGSATLELVKGVFRAVTGAIGKLKERDFKVKTELGTIGIRGTDFWGGFYFSKSLDVALLGGAGIYVGNAAGQVEVTAIGNGTTLNSASESPSTPKLLGDKKLSAAKLSVSLD